MVKRNYRFEKLVRDKILAHLKQDGQVAHRVRRLNNEEFVKSLIEKLREELEELETAKDKTDMVSELADLQELVDELIKALNINSKKLEEKQGEKRKKNGGFKKRQYIGFVEVPEESKWID